MMDGELPASASPSALPGGERRDLALVQRIREGDADALDQLLRAYWTPLLRYARSITGSLDSAQDILQDVFARLWRHRDTLDIRNGVSPYLYRMVRNQALTTIHTDLAARTREARWVADFSVITNASSNEGARAVDASEMRAALWRALDGVPPRCREIFLLSWEHGLSYAHIASMLDISVPTVRNQMSRAVKYLERLFYSTDRPSDLFGA
jgi:RNA polymerase sigma-70 factor (ECF subfamily)